MKLNLSSKNLNQHVNYINPTQSYTLNKVNEFKSTENFTLEIKKEVENLNKKDRKQAVKILKATYVAGMTILTLANPALAATATAIDPTVMSEFMSIMKFVVICSVIASSALAMILMMAAGASRMLRQNGSTAWTTDIIKGYIQCLVAVPLISLLLYSAIKLFKNVDLFFAPF